MIINIKWNKNGDKHQSTNRSKIKDWDKYRVENENNDKYQNKHQI